MVAKNSPPAKKSKKQAEAAQSSQKKSPLIVAPSPHLDNQENVRNIMQSVNLALVPAIAFSVYYFGWDSLLMILTSVVFCILSEVVVNKIRNRKFNEGSAVVTGILLALTLPPGLSLGFVALGAVFAIIVGKEIFGGLGYNIFNPALLGRAFLQASFPVRMTTWEAPKTLEAITTATPLGGMKFEQQVTPYFDLLIGNIGGSLGETCALALIVGGVYLLVRQHADWRIPAGYLGSVFVLGGLFWLFNPIYPDPIFHLFSGGLMLGAFFMATDMVTSPVTPKGAWIFGIGAGVILIIIRLYGGLPEGVMYSILLMNAFTPLINRYTRPKFFGEVKKNA